MGRITAHKIYDSFAIENYVWIRTYDPILLYSKTILQPIYPAHTNFFIKVIQVWAGPRWTSIRKSVISIAQRKMVLWKDYTA